MENKNVLSKLLAIAGTILVRFPILAPILISILFLLQNGIFRIGYLMRAELFLSFLLGSGLLLWAALRVHSQVKLLAWELGLAVFVLFARQAIAVVTSLATGKIEPAGWIWTLVLASLVIYTLGILLVGVEGARLTYDLQKKGSPA